ncbi:MAG: hypothetical protein U1E30_02945 [Rhodoblastus sp.]
MPDVLHWLGVDRVDRLVSMSNMKYESLRRPASRSAKRVPIPDGLDSSGTPRRDGGQEGGRLLRRAPSADDLMRTSGRPLEKY